MKQFTNILKGSERSYQVCYGIYDCDYGQLPVIFAVYKAEQTGKRKRNLLNRLSPEEVKALSRAAVNHEAEKNS
jgi:acyl-CoA synthetase (AMP-forming)/AMP-acid ligase II